VSVTIGQQQSSVNEALTTAQSWERLSMAVKGPIGDEEETAEDDIDEATRAPQSRIAPPPPKTVGRRRLLIGTAVGAGVVVVGGGAYLIGSGTSKSSKSNSNDPTLTTFRDPLTGFSIAYPKSWAPLTPPDPSIRLLLDAGVAGLDYFEIRVQQTQNVDPNNLTDVKAFTDSILSGSAITVLDQKPVTINGIHGYYYLYTLSDPASTPEKLVHSHYFLYQGHLAYFLVFQALLNDFSRLAPAAGKVVDSFRTFPPTASATTTAPKP
jgi:hypothetical protein